MKDTVAANEKITKLNTMYHELVTSACRTFNEVAAMKGVTGVYIVIGAEEEVVYIGSTTNSIYASAPTSNIRAPIH